MCMKDKLYGAANAAGTQGQNAHRAGERCVLISTVDIAHMVKDAGLIIDVHSVINLNMDHIIAAKQPNNMVVRM